MAALRIEQAIRARRADGAFAPVPASARIWRPAPVRRAPEYSTNPLVSRLRATRNGEAFGLCPRGTADRQARRENRL